MTRSVAVPVWVVTFLVFTAALLVCLTALVGALDKPSERCTPQGACVPAEDHAYVVVRSS